MTPPPTFELEKGWGQAGAPWNFTEVADVAIDGDDNVYAFGRGEGAVIQFDRSGRQQARWGVGDFGRPHGITVSPHEQAVYCVDCDGHAVRKYTADGTLLDVIESTVDVDYTGYTRFDSHSVRRAGPPFCYPTALALAPSGDLYVSDGYGNARVHRFTADGRLVRSWGSPGDAPGEFVLPHAVLVDGDRVYVADRENDRVQIFDLEGRYLTEWTDCYRPAALCVDVSAGIFLAELGRINVADGARRYFDFSAPAGRVTLRDEAGAVLSVISSDGSDLRDDYFSPHGIAVDSMGDLYVAETYVTYFRGEAPERLALRKLRRTRS
jgi:sugar lactone lactonase YvrE